LFHDFTLSKISTKETWAMQKEKYIYESMIKKEEKIDNLRKRDSPGLKRKRERGEAHIKKECIFHLHPPFTHTCTY
jgi:hypothetical protein